MNPLLFPNGPLPHGATSYLVGGLLVGLGVSLIYLLTKNSAELSEIRTILNNERSNPNFLFEFNNNSSLLNTQLDL